MVTKNINCNTGSNQLTFCGKVDKSVNKYVKSLKKEAKEKYQQYCKNSNIKMNKSAYKSIEERCDTALSGLIKKAESLHNDTVIKITKNPYKKDGGLYLSAENKNLLQEWEQKGASERLSIYKNDLRTAENIGSVDYDAYITRFEKMADKVNPDNMDKNMVKMSISNLWHLSIQQIQRGCGKKEIKSTQRMANEIKYPNTTFAKALTDYYNEIQKNS